MLTCAYGAGVEGIPKQGQQRRAMDGISEAKSRSFGSGLRVLNPAGWRSPDRSGRRGDAESGCN